MTIMLVEDEYPIAQAIERYLTEMGHTVDMFYDGLEALQHCDTHETYEVYIIDINLPGANGLTLLEKIRKIGVFPVIIISADTDIETIDKAYRLGCEDYLKKPFHIKELAIKLEKMMKPEKTKVLLSNRFTFDTNARMLFEDEKHIDLTKKELLFLELLLAHRGKIVTNDQIQDVVYGFGFMSDLALRTLVKRLRMKIGKELIHNISGLGYKIE